MTNNKKVVGFISFLIIVVLVSLTACTDQTKPTTDETINQDIAIQAAIGYCKMPRLELVGDPQNIRAKLLTLEEAYQSIRSEGETTNFDLPMDTKVWLVQMDGQLQLVGGPLPVQSTNTPAITPTPSQPFWGTCSVILDGKSGSLIYMSG